MKVGELLRETKNDFDKNRTEVAAALRSAFLFFDKADTDWIDRRLSPTSIYAKPFNLSLTIFAPNHVILNVVRNNSAPDRKDEIIKGFERFISGLLRLGYRTWDLKDLGTGPSVIDEKPLEELTGEALFNLAFKRIESIFAFEKEDNGPSRPRKLAPKSPKIPALHEVKMKVAHLLEAKKSDDGSKPFNYREWAGVKIHKVHFSSGIGGPEYAKKNPEKRSGNFYGGSKELWTAVKKLKNDGWYIHNGWETFGKEWKNENDKEGTHFERSIVVMVKKGEKGAMAVPPSGKTKQIGSKAWKPEIKDFKE